eukprot:PITA_07810
MADRTGDITCIASSSSSSTNTGQVYDVFLNHRGPDTKKGLASHIYRGLIVRGLRVFLDQPELRIGEDIPSQIKEAIRTASVHVAIFSPNYAQSRWCLDELALMVESGSTIIPVFHNVNPSELRYARDLQTLENKRTFEGKPRFDSITLEKWRNALYVVSNKSGLDINACNGDEGQLVDAVVEEVWRKARKTPLNVAKYPTGLVEKIEDMERMVLLQQQSQKTKVVGIVGLGGVGKSTLAKEFFNRHTSNYDRYCFLSDVRETAAKNSLTSLQTKLLKDLTYLKDVQISNTDEGIEELRKHLSSHPRSLIVLDDVDHIDQLDALFSPVKDTIEASSLILVTSRNRDVLTSSGILEASIYRQTGLNPQQSRALFCSHAFDQSCPVMGFEPLVEDFLNFCDGLPLSLKVIGASIRGKDTLFWKRQLDKIIRILPTDIHSKLKISYDSLDKEEQQIFLDVACFFIGENRDTAIRRWNGSGWDGWLGLRNLENRCLVEIDRKECIRMHDHLRDLGRDVAEKEHPLRLSRPNVNLLPTLSPSSPVLRGISMDYGNGREQIFENITGNCNLSRLELLSGEGSFVESIFSAGELRQLIYLQWKKCPISSISLQIPTLWKALNLRVLYIEGEELNTLWQHESQAPLQLTELYIDAPLSEVPQSIGKLNQLERIVLKNGYFKNLPNEFCDMHSLKHITLQNCKQMMLLPDSVGILTGLQTLDFSGCPRLERLPDSVGQLTGLQTLDFSRCSSVERLPDSVGQLTGLQSLNLQECTRLQGLPHSVGQLTGLQTLNLESCTSLQGLPDSVGQLTGLQELGLSGCYSLQGLPDSVGQLTRLQELDLRFLQGLPDSVGQLTGLQTLDLHWCYNLQGLPDSVGQLTALQTLDFRWCPRLQGLPDSVGQLTALQILDLSWCPSLQGLPDSVGQLTGLQGLCLEECSSLQGLPDSVGQLTGLQKLNLACCSSLQGLPDSVGQLTGLQGIYLGGGFRVQGLPDSVGQLTSLEILDLRWCSSLQGLPESVGQLTGLQELDLHGCSSLRGLPESVGQLTGLQELDLHGCSSLRGLPDSVGQLTGLQRLYLCGCSSLPGLPDSVGQLTGIQGLDLRGCSSVQGLPDSVEQLTGLQGLDLRGCFSLQGLPESVGQLTGLQELDLGECSSLQGLPDSVGQLKGLQELDLRGCSSLQGLPDSVGQLTGLEELDLSGCSSLQGLPDSVGQLTGLERLDLRRCSSLQGLPESVGNLTRLKWLNLSGCFNLQMLPNFRHLSSMEELHLSGCFNLQMPPNVQHLSSLVKLYVSHCSKLQWGAGVVESLRHRLGNGFIEEGGENSNEERWEEGSENSDEESWKGSENSDEESWEEASENSDE